uniref:Uncharacterized protein n=1 Tax=Arundo donax TaxID=35708 RepID=A0A0A9A9I8_ARUDO
MALRRGTAAATATAALRSPPPASVPSGDRLLAAMCPAQVSILFACAAAFGPTRCRSWS